MGQVWAATDYAVIDIATTHLISAWARPCEIAGVTVRRGALDGADVYYTLVNPKRTIYKETIALHGITREMVKDAPCFKQQREQFENFLHGKIIVVHSGNGYDMRVLQRRMKEYIFPTVIDTRDLAKALDTDAPDYKLATLVERYELGELIQRRLAGSDVGRYRALHDAYAAAYIFVYLVRRRIGERATLDDVMHVCPKGNSR